MKFQFQPVRFPMPDERPLLLILGASVRSAAHSALRAGFHPICADTFADEDLRSTADVLPIHVDEYPKDLIRCAGLAPPCPWMYTGALENYPHVVHAISAARPLWGNDAETIRIVRDPILAQAALLNAGLPVPDVRSASAPPPPDGTWVVKPDRSGGGRGIYVWNERALHCATLKEPHWFQKRIDGESLAALFIASGGKSTLIGVTRQWVGTKSFHGPTHGYCGTLGPLLLSAKARQQIARLGDVLAGAAHLQGICGVDGIWNDEGFWPVDINPRYTASVEVLEHAFDVPLIAWHARACGPTANSSVCEELDQCLPKRPLRYGAKAILFAKKTVVVPRLAGLFSAAADSPHDLPVLADRPAPGTKFAAGEPVCSIFGWGNSEQESEEELIRRVSQVEQALYPP